MKLCILLVLLLATIISERGFAQSTKPLQHIWEVQPDFGDIWHRPAIDRTILFDVESLASEQVLERVRVAQMICREHDNSNFKDRARALELLVERLKSNAEPLQAQRAMISAATLLSDGSHAAQLWELAQADSLLRSTVEKALIKWKSPVALGAWRSRIQDRLAKPADIAMALEGLASAGNSEDTAILKEVLCGNRTTLANRYLAASALGTLNREGLNELAQLVLESDVEQRHLLAAHLLKQHTGDPTLAQLKIVFSDGSDVAQLISAQALVEHFPVPARELAPQWIDHTDSSVRRLALESLHKLSDEASLRLQAKLWSDRNVVVRRLAGSQLVQKAAQGQRTLVDECVTENLNAETWTGIEQAIIVSVNLQDRSRCSRLVELLEHPRPEVNMHAAWALMELVQDPAIMVNIEKHVAKMTAHLSEFGTSPPITNADMIRLSFLHEVFGRNLHEPATEMLQKYIPKNNFKLGIVSRASAIWALGQLNKDKDNATLRKSLCERIADVPPVQPEDYLVRFVCVLALGEMGFADSIDTIQEFREGLPAPLGYACNWALEQIEQSGSNPK